jgi:hypothetical protein
MIASRLPKDSQRDTRKFGVTLSRRKLRRDFKVRMCPVLLPVPRKMRMVLRSPHCLRKVRARPWSAPSLQGMGSP